MKFALPFVKISFHPIFSTVGRHTNFFMSYRAASQPYSHNLIQKSPTGCSPIGRHSHVVPPILHQTLLTLNMLTIVTVDTYYFQHPSLQGELQKLSGVFTPTILSLNLHRFLLFLVNVKYKLFSWYQISPQNSIVHRIFPLIE